MRKKYLFNNVTIEISRIGRQAARGKKFFLFLLLLLVRLQESTNGSPHCGLLVNWFQYGGFHGEQYRENVLDLLKFSLTYQDLCPIAHMMSEYCPEIQISSIDQYSYLL